MQARISGLAELLGLVLLALNKRAKRAGFDESDPVVSDPAVSDPVVSSSIHSTISCEEFAKAQGVPCAGRSDSGLELESY